MLRKKIFTAIVWIAIILAGLVAGYSVYGFAGKNTGNPANTEGITCRNGASSEITEIPLRSIFNFLDN